MEICPSSSLSANKGYRDLAGNGYHDGLKHIVKKYEYLMQLASIWLFLHSTVLDTGKKGQLYDLFIINPVFTMNILHCKHYGLIKVYGIETAVGVWIAGCPQSSYNAFLNNS